VEFAGGISKSLGWREARVGKAGVFIDERVGEGEGELDVKGVHTSHRRGPSTSRFSRSGNTTVQAHEFRCAPREVLLRRQNASLDLARTLDVAGTSTPPSSSSSSEAP
jgi:hypothetical protein